MFQQENQNEKITFINMNADCLYLIFDRLDIKDLINMAQISEEYTHIATSVYRRKYSEHEIRMGETEYDRVERLKPSPIDIIISSNYIKIKDLKLASNFMKFFGNKIQKLVMYNYPKLPSDWAILNRIVNKYGAESLTKLKMSRFSKEIWSQFSQPFKNIKTMDIDIEGNTDGMKLNWMCPKLKSLNIIFIREANYDFIDCELPHLEHLHISFHNVLIWNRKEEIIGLIKKNPQIRSMDIVPTIPELAQVVNELLPRLESITLRFDDQGNQPLHFENVKHCAVSSNYDYVTVTNLSFSHLESLEIQYPSMKLEKYIEFIGRHRNLKRLRVNRSMRDGIDLNELTAELSNLEEMIVTFYSGINIEKITTFIGNHPTLMKFQFPVQEISESNREILCQRFKSDWHIKSIFGKRDAFLFERMNKL